MHTPHVSAVMDKIVLLSPFYHNPMLMCQDTRGEVLCKVYCFFFGKLTFHQSHPNVTHTNAYSPKKNEELDSVFFFNLLVLPWGQPLHKKLVV